MTRLSSTAARRLGRRLRALREDEFSGLVVKQSELAKALGASDSAVSSWESAAAAPPPHRLEAYARFFCTSRSVEERPFRLLEESQLTPAEMRRMRALLGELQALHDAVRDERPQRRDELPERRGMWRFADGAAVTIVCPDVPRRDRSRFADPTDRNYIRAHQYGDLDAFIDVYGEVRAENPTAVVRGRLASKVAREEIADHVILLGGISLNHATRWLVRSIDLPVRQRSLEDDGDENFAVLDGEARGIYAPEFADWYEDGRQLLVSDIGLFARLRNPHNPNRTLTICDGITTRGVHGAALAFMSPGLRERNLERVAECVQSAPSFAVLMRVSAYKAEAYAPDLTRPGALIGAWPLDDANAQEEPALSHAVA